LCSSLCQTYQYHRPKRPPPRTHSGRVNRRLAKRRVQRGPLSRRALCDGI